MRGFFVPMSGVGGWREAVGGILRQLCRDAVPTLPCIPCQRVNRSTNQLVVSRSGQLANRSTGQLVRLPLCSTEPPSLWASDCVPLPRAHVSPK